MCGLEEWEEEIGYREVERVGEGMLEEREVASGDTDEEEVEESVGV